MNLTALTLVGVAVGLGQPAGDYLPVKTRQLKLDIDYVADQRKDIQQVQLCVSRDQGQTWEVADSATPDRDHLVFNAKDDGPHWVTMLIVFKDGRKDPTHPSKAPPDRIQQLLVDATPPTVRVTSAKRVGEEVVVEWTVEDAYPSNAAPQVAFKTAAAVAGDWQPVPPTAVSRSSARFNPGSSGPVTVQVTAADLAGNTASATSEAAGGVTTTTTAAFTPAAATDGPAAPGGPIMPSIVDPARVPQTPEGPAVAPAVGTALPTIGLPPPVIPPSFPGGPTPAPLSPPVPTPSPSAQPAVPPAQPAGPPVASGAPNWAPSSPVGTTSAPTEQVIAAGAGTASPAAAVPANVKAVNFLRFDLQYHLDLGPSGVRQIDLYVTRDDGRTWSKWSQHDGRENPLRVALDTRYNPQPEGDYGFRLVPVSGAGLTDGPPAPGSPPEMRVRVDVTAPMIKVFAPVADPNQRNTLTLRWEATDANFGPNPILIEWSELPVGPWKPVAGGDGGFPPVGFGAAGPNSLPANRLPNTGTYAWALPASLATHQVYLKFTAWDAAGNKSEVATPSPVLVDLTKPRAKIQGISAGPVLPR